MVDLAQRKLEISVETLARPMIVAENAHVTYQVYAGGKTVGVRNKILGARADSIKSVPALRGVSFTASEGESIGVVGHNGSGKSTLFRAMAGLIPATEGKIWAADRPVLLGVNAALMPELSGEDNIKLGLLAMGFTTEEAAAQVDEIADFAELNDFIGHPMRTYSSGMGARLRFAIASARAHSILLLDEALAVGDRRFRLKSEERIRGLRDAAGLVMIVSHSASSLKDTCERGLWIHKGQLLADGSIADVVAEYTKWTKDPTSVAVGAAIKPTPLAQTPSKPADEVPGATITATASTTVRAREIARRKRFLDVRRKRNRRRGLAIAMTGVAVVAAVGAGAAIALVTRESDRIELDELRAVSANPPPPSPSATPLLPVINAFTAQPTALCEVEDATVDVPLSWDVVGATTVSVQVVGADGVSVTLLENQPATMSAQAVPFSCVSPSLTFTLTSANKGGQQVSSNVVVTRDLKAAPEPTEDPEMYVPGETDAPVPETPTGPEPPVVVPPTEPVPPVTPEPPVEPEPPVDPEPSDPPVVEPEPEPTAP